MLGPWVISKHKASIPIIDDKNRKKRPNLVATDSDKSE
ncbi:hypothetical protein JCM19239_6187 [Vibrio variabilis]|uniref:Uncharacterized protein n=1 Tax=Vibrio variabilis TaxID=990271 RepID=A0ABQ0JJ25_9VIBR|nr:hypothetical protein JCM19239_6187 [Vibrio variabilis]